LFRAQVDEDFPDRAAMLDIVDANTKAALASLD